MEDANVLGQRELEVGGTFEPTEEEQKLLDDNNVSAVAVQSFVDSSGKQTINAAVSGLKAKQAREAADEEAKKGEAGAGSGEGTGSKTGE